MRVKSVAFANHFCTIQSICFESWTPRLSPSFEEWSLAKEFFGYAILRSEMRGGSSFIRKSILYILDYICYVINLIFKSYEGFDWNNDFYDRPF